MLFDKPLLLWKPNERPSRLTHGLGLMMGKNPASGCLNFYLKAPTDLKAIQTLIADSIRNLKPS